MLWKIWEIFPKLCLEAGYIVNQQQKYFCSIDPSCYFHENINCLVWRVETHELNLVPVFIMVTDLATNPQSSYLLYPEVIGFQECK